MIKYTAIKYFSLFGSMAFFMLASIMVEQRNSAPDPIFLSVISFTLGLYSGDPNSLVYFQRKFRNNICNTSLGYWMPRLLLTIIISLVCFLLVKKLDFTYFMMATLLAFMLPQGRVSNPGQFQVIIFSGGLLKIIISILIINESESGNQILPILICLATCSNYIVSFFYHAMYIKNDITYRKTSNEINFINEFVECSKSFLITLPIHFYTSLGGFVYINLKGESGISIYYLYDRIIRGLGATVIVIQSKTMSDISKLSLKIERITINEIKNYILIYLIFGIIVGILFVILGKQIFDIIGFSASIFNNAYILLIPLSVSSMYISNLIGVQMYMVNNNFKVMTISAFIAILAFYAIIVQSNNILLMITVPEISVGIFLLLYLFLSLNKKSQRNINNDKY